MKPKSQSQKLHLLFILADKDTITLKFSYLPKLQVVTVLSSVDLDQVLESKFAG